MIQSPLEEMGRENSLPSPLSNSQFPSSQGFDPETAFHGSVLDVRSEMV